uniref:JmjC domain-containing protein n=1 Tax=Pyrodinium bahamense TaxID=73915 RepID=A0A7S0F901_9DINO|mmetsp:Transcript_13570/g.37682  ORF Transcript_13570/g.37682 Transcript_13570/m.37682 type:complete len:468 (+) Transcript_13570:112-1515(+)
MGVPSTIRPGSESRERSPVRCKADASAAAAEEYARHVRQVLEVAGWPWPEHVMLHPEKMPRFITTPAEFLREIQVGCHMDQIVVFPNGLRAIGQDRAMGAAMWRALGLDEPNPAESAYQVLERLAETGEVNRLKGKVAFRRKPEDRLDVPVGGSLNGNLAKKWEALRAECPEEARGTVYLSEVRLLEAERVDHGLRKRRKSTMETTMRERAHKLGMEVENMLHWDDYSEGFFVGADNSGYGLHVDCIPSSNVGSVFAGHKLLAIWGYNEESSAVMKGHSRELFVPPLSKVQVGALERACAVALAPPGSIYIFSGSSAHAVANVGFTAPSCDGGAPRPSLVASSYEAFVGLHPRHAEVLVDTCANSPDSDSDLEDFQDEVGTTVRGIAWRLLNDKVAEDEAARKVVSVLRASCPRIRSKIEDMEERMEAKLDNPQKRRRQIRRRGCRQGTSSSSTADHSEQQQESEVE